MSLFVVSPYICKIAKAVFELLCYFQLWLSLSCALVFDSIDGCIRYWYQISLARCKLFHILNL